MDLTSLIEIIIAIVIIYFFIRFIVSPVFRIVFGVIAFFILIYLLQKFLGFDVNKVLSPFGISFDMAKWNLNFGWLLGPMNYYLGKIEIFLRFIWGNTPKVKTN